MGLSSVPYCSILMLWADGMRRRSTQSRSLIPRLLRPVSRRNPLLSPVLRLAKASITQVANGGCARALATRSVRQRWRDLGRATTRAGDISPAAGRAGTETRTRARSLSLAPRMGEHSVGGLPASSKLVLSAAGPHTHDGHPTAWKSGETEQCARPHKPAPIAARKPGNRTSSEQNARLPLEGNNPPPRGALPPRTRATRGTQYLSLGPWAIPISAAAYLAPCRPVGRDQGIVLGEPAAQTAPAVSAGRALIFICPVSPHVPGPRVRTAMIRWGRPGAST